MLVKIVNLTDNRFKNCRSSNFSNQYASFGNGLKPPKLPTPHPKVHSPVKRVETEDERFERIAKELFGDEPSTPGPTRLPGEPLSD